jgi:hypothetical protein
MIKKLDLVTNIEKYYLGGIIESVKWIISNDKLHIDFVSPNQDLVGHLDCGIKIGDNTVGIYNTSGLLKMLSILETDILLNVESQYKIPTKLLIEDSNFSLQYSLADPYIVPATPSISEPTYDITFDIDVEFITRFIKAKNALGSNTRDICRISSYAHEDGGKQAKFVLGEPTSHANKIEFTCLADYEALKISSHPFNSSYIKEILNANKGDYTSAKGYLSAEGLLKLEFITAENGHTVYYLPELRL